MPPINHRIARNTLMLYLRMLFSMIVGFYTSRVVLNALGVEDYGTLGLVGGVVSILSFLNASLGTATSRFLTYDLGLGDTSQLAVTFNAALQSHLIIALIVFVFSETIGLYLVSYHLDIPDLRISAAHIVYQLSVVSSIIGILQTPYSALLVSHEQMDIYAWFEILTIVLKLIIVWMLSIATVDRMVLYASLSLLVTIAVFILYIWYCRSRYPESKPRSEWQSSVVRKILVFSGWSLYADASVSIRQQGINILINRFFGVVLNASCALASMIQGALWTCGYYVMAAFRPQIVKQCANDDYSSMQHLMGQSLQYTFLLFCLFSVPAVLCMPYLMQFWLGQVPPYAVVLCQILIIDNLFGLINHTFSIAIYAKGTIRSFSLLNGTLKLLSLPCIFLILRSYPNPVYPFLFNLLLLIVINLINLNLLKRHIYQLQILQLLSPLFKAFVIVSVSFIIVLPFHFMLQGGEHLLTISLLFPSCMCLGTLFFIFDADQRRSIFRRLACLQR